MGCFFSKKRAKKEDSSTIEKEEVKKKSSKYEGSRHTIPSTFTFQELARATNNFGADRLISEGGFGKLYKGWLEKSKQIVAIKQFDQAGGLQGNRAFLVDLLMSSLLNHPNLVDLIGYCVDGDRRLLVFEYMPLGSLSDLLHDRRSDQSPLDWKTRMNIAAGISRGIEYLHCTADPPVIYRNWKSSNILLDKDYRPVLSNFGLAKLGPTDGEPLSTRVIGTPGYVAPEYAMEGLASLASDVYSFGVILLEIISGRKAIDVSKAPGKRNIVAWVRPRLENRKKYATIVDPVLEGRYPTRDLYQALAIAAMCIHEQPCMRPRIRDVRLALDCVASREYGPEK